jgi:ADP-L-glycero-D-manno-heptose 6-epimerase
MKMYDDKLIVVTGGAGFIGSNVIKYLNETGMNNILVVDELGTDERWKNLVGKQFVDILEKDQLFDWLQDRESEIEAFIHLGACSDTTETNASFLLQNNYRYTIRLAEYALKHGHRFIYASSAATYGNGALGFSDNDDELVKLEPLNMYGYSKHLFDLWIQQQGLLHEVVGLKYFNVFGPNEWHKGRMASLIFHALPQIRKEGVIRLFKSSEPNKYPDGGQQRDFLYVKDAARMTVQFLENNAGGIFNVGSGIPSTWNEVAAAIFEAAGVPLNIEYIDMPADLRGKYQNYTCADMKKTKKVLGQAANTRSLNDAVQEYVQHYLIPDRRC